MLVHLRNTGLVDPAVEELKPLENDFIVYPNPTSDYLMISLNIKERTDVKITMVNTLGQKIYSETLKDVTGKVTKLLQIDNFAKGIYFVNVIMDGNSSSKKVVKQ